MKGDHGRALKIFETALGELGLPTEGQSEATEQGQALLESAKTTSNGGGSSDLACLIFNYIKCVAFAKGGAAKGVDFFKADPTTRKLFAYLVQMSSPFAREFFEERQKAETMFD